MVTLGPPAPKYTFYFSACIRKKVGYGSPKAVAWRRIIVRGVAARRTTGRMMMRMTIASEIEQGKKVVALSRLAIVVLRGAYHPSRGINVVTAMNERTAQGIGPYEDPHTKTHWLVVIF
jgi:hypothetical protein